MTEWLDKPDGPGHWLMLYQHPTDPVIWQIEVRRWGRGMQLRSYRTSVWHPLADSCGPTIRWLRIPMGPVAATSR